MPATGPDFISCKRATSTHRRRSTSSTSASSARRPDLRTPLCSKRSQSRSRSARSLRAPTSHPWLSPASVPRSGCTPPTSRASTMLSWPTATPSSPHRSTAPSAGHSPSPTPTATTSPSTTAPDRRPGDHRNAQYRAVTSEESVRRRNQKAAAGSPHSSGGPFDAHRPRPTGGRSGDARIAVGVGGSDHNTGPSGVTDTRRLRSLTRCDPSHRPDGQASRIAATPWPPAAQIETRARTGLPAPFCSAFRCASCLAA